MALNDLEQAIEQAITAIKLGDKASGLEILAQITQIEPINAAALIWLAYTLST